MNFLCINSSLTLSRVVVVLSPESCCLSLPVVVAHRPHGRLEVGRGLLLDLVGQRVDLEPVEAGDKLVRRALGAVLKGNQTIDNRFILVCNCTCSIENACKILHVGVQPLVYYGCTIQ